MIFDKEFEKVGIKRVEDCGNMYAYSPDEYMYEYSDYETLTFTAKDWKCADGGQAVEIYNFNIEDLINYNTHVRINYPMYFRKVEDFFQLLKLIGYKVGAL